MAVVINEFEVVPAEAPREGQGSKEAAPAGPQPGSRARFGGS